MAGIMDLFRPAQQQQPAAQQPAQQPQQQQPNQQQQQPTPPAGSASGVAPNTPAAPAGQMPGSQQQPVNPLDAYNNLWNNANTKTELPPSFTLDPKILSDAANTMNFTQNIPAELMQKATSGDAEAMITMMNLVGRNAYQSSLAHSSSLTDKFVAARSEFDLKGIDSKVTQKLTNTALADSPNYQHPVVKAEFTRIANAFQAQNPDAGPAEIAKATKEYMQNLHSAMNPGAGQAGGPASKEPEATNWEEWILK